jgi:hypothetical protein
LDSLFLIFIVINKNSAFASLRKRHSLRILIFILNNKNKKRQGSSKSPFLFLFIRIKIRMRRDKGTNLHLLIACGLRQGRRYSFLSLLLRQGATPLRDPRLRRDKGQRDCYCYCYAEGCKARIGSLNLKK